ncbi:hypothetical protein Zmor_015903 [Zophobas morio]|uniref:Uncharacterized protein n=1 Tax=Zophobas morio TaxID=2755281 RepID=A0AA38MHZ4_9CUCU|nr:hypothetical protein Zmor_015903 [Zophobas morio]
MCSAGAHLIISCDYGYNWGRADRKLRATVYLLPPGNDACQLGVVACPRPGVINRALIYAAEGGAEVAEGIFLALLLTFTFGGAAPAGGKLREEFWVIHVLDCVASS